MAKVAGPYLLIHFFLMPLPCLLISQAAYANAVATLFLADVLTNIHSFIIIATNHAGSDLYKFEEGCKPNSATFYMRQVVSSANFKTGGDWNDFWHGWLNYQIEHHVWPNLSALSYQRGQPELKVGGGGGGGGGADGRTENEERARQGAGCAAERARARGRGRERERER